MHEVYVRVTGPSDYTDAYDTAIAAMNMTAAEEVQFTFDEFRMFVLDKWDWAPSFLNSVADYSKTAAALNGTHFYPIETKLAAQQR